MHDDHDSDNRLNLIISYGTQYNYHWLEKCTKDTNSIIGGRAYLVENIVENSNLKLIVNKKNYEQIKELFEDFMNDLIEGQNKKKIESLERKLINNMEENAYSELLKLKNQINRE